MQSLQAFRLGLLRRVQQLVNGLHPLQADHCVQEHLHNVLSSQFICEALKESTSIRRVDWLGSIQPSTI